jgi:tetratricopeptide (TPR) repeat protein
MTDCPSEETLAAFLDGRLDPEARSRVLEHLADCGEDREVVYAGEEIGRLGVAEGEGADVPEVLEFRSRTRYGWAAIGSVAAAAVLVLFIPAVQEQIAFSRTGGLSAVQTAYENLKLRPIESRLVGFDYIELEPAMRGNKSGDDELGKALLDAAEARIAAEDGDPSWRELRALASARLLLGKRDDAVALMERAFVLRPDAPGLRNDLAAVYAERARWTRQPEHAKQALNAAEQAWALSQTPETAWNRALALGLAGRDEQARHAWEEYLKLDASGPWSDEARKNLRDLETP